MVRHLEQKTGEMLPLSRAFSRRPKMLLQRGCASTTTPFNTACAKFRKQLPGFPIKKNQVHILNTPTSFYERLLVCCVECTFDLTGKHSHHRRSYCAVITLFGYRAYVCETGSMQCYC